MPKPLSHAKVLAKLTAKRRRSIFARRLSEITGLPLAHNTVRDWGVRDMIPTRWRDAVAAVAADQGLAVTRASLDEAAAILREKKRALRKSARVKQHQLSIGG